MKKNGFKEFLCSGIGKAGMIIVFYAVIFLLVLLIGQIFEGGGGEYVALVLMLVFAVFGWKALNKIQPDIFLFMPIVGWIIFFVIKGVLSVLIGIFVAPFVIAKKITEAIQKSLSDSE